MNTKISNEKNMKKTMTNTTKAGLLKLGFVTNLKTCKEDLNSLLPESEQVNTVALNAIVDRAEIKYLNWNGFDHERNGEPVSKEKAAYLYFGTGKNDKEGRPIIGWFERKYKDSTFKGVFWGTMISLRTKIHVAKMFSLGDLSFDREADGLAFLEDIAASTIPETWSFKNKPSTINHPILKSYIENIFEVLKKEKEKGAKNKIVVNDTGKYLVFNTNLLDKYFHEILILVEIRTLKDGSKLLVNPRRVKKELELRKMGFPRDAKPEQPRFFEKMEEVIYQPTWKIDHDFDKFTHIIEERRNRFPVDMQGASSDELSRKLGDAIEFAIAIAQRNYKFIVPMYRPQTGQIQLLMPIYLKGTYSTQPDFALILSPDKQNEFYIPETILPLEAVYQNARLIAKPDDTWLNPDNIL